MAKYRKTAEAVAALTPEQYRVTQRTSPERPGIYVDIVSDDGPRDRGGLPYCINSATLRSVHRDDMEAQGYAAYVPQVEIVA